MARSVTLAAIAFGLVLLSYLGVSNFRAAKDSESQETQSERDRKRPEPAGKLPKNP
jgi:threonine/homoserine/homoserine lactone efflux protein